MVIIHPEVVRLQYQLFDVSVSVRQLGLLLEKTYEMSSGGYRLGVSR